MSHAGIGIIIYRWVEIEHVPVPGPITAHALWQRHRTFVFASKHGRNVKGKMSLLFQGDDAVSFTVVGSPAAKIRPIVSADSGSINSDRRVRYGN
ncbi:hypothetical protein EVAR_20078_1 [Eumeta japonica]|uniref:Uncharacterized protein n=1 Tax=Eumeta variegata TaxID=151549 RepID=A0A4C1UHU6_EUMVA|nr:hypothetical protein EVAR_20078_1 [Eumeta japonica]